MTPDPKTPPQTAPQATGPIFKPAPGYIIGKPLKREELAQRQGGLALPDSVGKEKDSVGVAEVLLVGEPDLATVAAVSGVLERVAAAGDELLDGIVKQLKVSSPEVRVGDLVAYIPFTDAIIMEGFEKRNVIAYKNVVAVARADRGEAPRGE